MTNQLLKERLKKINKLNRGCKERSLYREIKKDFNIILKGSTFLEWIVETEEIQKQRLAVRDSVYQDWSLLDSPAIRGLNLIIPAVFGDILELNNVKIGIDKLEHFFGYGYYYFKIGYLDKKSIEKALKFGLFMEYFSLGAYGTGIMSYGDLSANFNGMPFWNHILNKNKDVMDKNLGPYVVCQKNQWIQGKLIDWANYVDPSFDESINCGRFRKENMALKVRNRVKMVASRKNKNLTCPFSDKALSEITHKYSRYSPYIINSEGHSVIPKFTTWKLFHDL